MNKAIFTQIISCLATISWGIAPVYLYARGLIGEYLSESFHLIALSGGLAMIVLGLFNLLHAKRTLSCGHDHTHQKADHDHHEHAHGEYDAHIWLDPFNAKVIANNIAEELSKLDPKNTSTYQNNRDKFVERVSDTEEKISQQLDHYISYVTFHDAYQYFANRFDVASSGALTINPDVMPGARQLSDVREMMADNDIQCIFSEPQFNPKVIEVIADDTNTKMGILDPLGATIPLGKDHYFEVLTDIANSLEDCGHDH